MTGSPVGFARRRERARGREGWLTLTHMRSQCVSTIVSANLCSGSWFTGRV